MMLKEGDIFAGRYKLIAEKGRGTFGEVWQAKDEMLGMVVALKVYIALDERGIEEFKSEYKNTFNLNHPNLLHATYFDILEKRPYLVMPYCPASADELVGKTSEEEVWRFIKDVSSGLAYLHSKDIMHRDIKPDNILRDEQGDYLISDFGISTKMRSTLRRNSVRALSESGTQGTIGYMGPEMFSSSPEAVKATDIWALGATIFEILENELPFFGQGGVMLLHGGEVPNMKGPWSDSLKAVVFACLAKDPWQRPKAEELEEYASARLSGKKVEAPWEKRWRQLQQAEAEKAKAEQERLRKLAEAEAEEERKRIAEEKRRREEEARRAAEEEKRRLAEEKRKREEELKRQKEEEKRRQAEEKRKREEELRKKEEERKRIAEEKRRQEEEARRAAEEEKRRLAEEKRRREEELKRQKEEEKRRQAEEKRKREEELRKEEEEAKLRAEEERKRIAEEKRRRKEEARKEKKLRKSEKRPGSKKGLKAVLVSAIGIAAVIGVVVFSNGRNNRNVTEIDENQSTDTIQEGFTTKVEPQKDSLAVPEIANVERETVNVESVSIDRKKAELKVGTTITLKATVNPANAENNKVKWTSDKPSVASVNPKGTVVALKPGSARITVTTDDGGKTTICTVTVISEEDRNEPVQAQPQIDPLEAALKAKDWAKVKQIADGGNKQASYEFSNHNLSKGNDEMAHNYALKAGRELATSIIVKLRKLGLYDDKDNGLEDPGWK